MYDLTVISTERCSPKAVTDTKKARMSGAAEGLFKERGGEVMKSGYNIKNTGAQIVKAPKNVSVSSGVHGIRGADVRCGAKGKNTKEIKK